MIKFIPSFDAQSIPGEEIPKVKWEKGDIIQIRKWNLYQDFRVIDNKEFALQCVTPILENNAFEENENISSGAKVETANNTLWSPIYVRGTQLNDPVKDGSGCDNAGSCDETSDVPKNSFEKEKSKVMHFDQAVSDFTTDEDEYCNATDNDGPKRRIYHRGNRVPTSEVENDGSLGDISSDSDNSNEISVDPATPANLNRGKNNWRRSLEWRKSLNKHKRIRSKRYAAADIRLIEQILNETPLNQQQYAAMKSISKLTHYVHDRSKALRSRHHYNKSRSSTRIQKSNAKGPPSIKKTSSLFSQSKLSKKESILYPQTAILEQIAAPPSDKVKSSESQLNTNNK